MKPWLRLEARLVLTVVVLILTMVIINLGIMLLNIPNTAAFGAGIIVLALTLLVIPGLKIIWTRKAKS